MTLETKNRTLVSYSEHPISKIALFTRNYNEQGFLVSNQGNNMKKCFKCGCEKPLSEFYKHPQMGDGHLNKCKDCTKKDVREMYLDRFQNAEWILHERERTRQRYHRLNYREKYKPDQEQKRSIIKRYYEAHPEKQNAKNITSYAIKSGRLVKQPCTVCGETDAQAHHEDYSKPLDVVWLCVKHHNERHIQIRKEQLLQRLQIAS